MIEYFWKEYFKDLRLIDKHRIPIYFWDENTEEINKTKAVEGEARWGSRRGEKKGVACDGEEMGLA
jgi:hypothetical protein